MPPKITIRPAQKHDRAQIIPLAVQLYRDNMDPTDRPLVDNYPALIARSWEKVNFRKGIILIAQAAEKIVGYVRGAVHGSDAMYPYKKLAYVGELIVHETHQRQGIGRALLAAFEKFVIAKGVDRVMLSADAHVTTRAFYEKVGYHVNQYRLLKILP